MDWLNLHTSTLDDPILAAADDTQRSHWLHLTRHCIGQENNGRIRGAALWTDRKWLLLCRTPPIATLSPCELWRWDGDDLIVWGYPKDKQKLVQAQREGGALGGLRSAQARAAKAASSAASSPSISPATELEGNGKGKRTEGKAEARPQSIEQVKAYAKSLGLAEVEAETFFDHFTANGWLVGGRAPMKSWQATFRNWKRRAGDFSRGQAPAKNATAEAGERTAFPLILGAEVDA